MAESGMGVWAGTLDRNGCFVLFTPGIFWQGSGHAMTNLTKRGPFSPRGCVSCRMENVRLGLL